MFEAMGHRRWHKNGARHPWHPTAAAPTLQSKDSARAHAEVAGIIYLARLRVTSTAPERQRAWKVACLCLLKACMITCLGHWHEFDAISGSTEGGTKGSMVCRFRGKCGTAEEETVGKKKIREHIHI